MNWDRQSKRKLHEMVEIKLHAIADRTKFHKHDDTDKARTLVTQRETHFKQFFEEFDIRYVPSYPAKRKNRVVITNPWFGLKAVGGPHQAISIPNEVAEKFLTLGIP
jgi:hypothetical protein